MSLPRYPKYKDSGVEWLGEVPDHWEVKRFQRCVRIAEGQVDPEDHRFASMSLIAPNHIESGTGRLLGLESAEEQGAESGKYLCKAGDLVYSKIRPALRKVCIAPEDCLCSADMYPLRAHSGLCNPFLLWLMLSEQFSSLAVLESQRVAMPKINRESLNEVALVLPTLPEQTAIVAFLGRETTKIDALVAEQERLIELLKEKRQAVISHAVTKGLNPKVPMKDSGVEWLRAVPDHWEESPLKALFSLKHGFAFDGEAFSDSGEHVLMTPGHFHERGGFRPKVSEKFYVGRDIPPEFILRSGQMLVAMTEQAPGLLGSALFVPEGMPYLHNQRLGLVRNLRTERLSEGFLFHLLNSDRLRAEITVFSTGAKVKHTSPDRILSIKVFLPPLSEQARICDALDKQAAGCDALEAAAGQTIDLLHERRAALISAAVTGQMDVRKASGKAA